MRKSYPIDYIVGPTKASVYGIKRYQDEVHSRIRGVRLKRLEYDVPLNRVLSVLRRLLFTFEVFAKTRNQAPKHFTTQYLAYLGLLPGMENSVVTVYDTVFIERHGDFPFLNRAMNYLNAEGIRRAKRIITISDYSANQIVTLLGIDRKKIMVIKPGIDLGFFKRKTKGKRGVEGFPTVLFVGSEDPRQNVDKILMAVARLKKRYPGIMFLKAGNPQWRGAREKLLGLVDRLGLKENVRFLGYVPEERLPSLYSSADVFVYPCSSTGWGLPPAEAMACGTPVVTSKTPPLPEVVGEGALKINPESADEITEAIRKLLIDRKLCAKLSKEGRLHLKTLGWGLAARRTDGVYRSMME